jgi:hypothetical protein
VRYRARRDRRGLLAGVPLDHLNFSHGMSGWWACGFIEPAPGADVVLEDTWGRPVVVLDEATTAGAMLLTASGPLAGVAWGDEHAGLLTLYRQPAGLRRRPEGRPMTDAPGLRVAHAPPAAAPKRGRVGLVFNGVWSQYAFATAPKYRDLYELVYVHELSYARVRDLDALVIPFQSNHAAIAERRDAVYGLLADGRTVAAFGDTSPAWIDAQWEWRPTNNWWWVDDPTRPPVAHTDFTHPLFKGLAQRTPAGTRTAPTRASRRRGACCS